MAKKTSDTKKQRSTKIKKQNRFLFFYWTVFCCLLLTIFFTEAASQLDPDLGWHLRVGQDIFVNKQIPHLETYTYPTLGESWIDHEWLSNLLLFILYSSAGEHGHWLLSFVFSIFVLATFFIVLLGTKKYLLPKTSPLRFAFLSSLAIFSSVHSILIFFGNRLQVLSWFFLALCFFLFAKIFSQKKYKLLFAFPFIFALWANLHGSFVFGLGLIGVFCLFFLFQKNSLKEKVFVAGITALTILSTLLTPYHFELWRLIALEYTANRSYLSSIVEWMPIYAKPNILWLPSLYISFFIFLALINWSKKLFSKKKNFALFLLFTLAMLALAIKSRRFLPFFSFASIPLITFFLKNIFQEFNINKKYLSVLLGLLFIVTSLFALKHFPLPKNIFQTQTAFSPFLATQYIKANENLSNLRLFNSYDWGGYLDWTMQDKQVFIDGRMPQKPLLNGTTFFEEYQKFFQPESAKAMLEEYDIEIVMLESKTPFVFTSKIEKFVYKNLFLLEEKDLQPNFPFYDFLEQKWDKIYEDEMCSVFTRPKSK